MAQPCSSTSESVQRAEHAAVETWRVAALMLGNEAEALRLIESTVASVEIDPCADPSAAGTMVRERVLDAMLPDHFQRITALMAGLTKAERELLTSLLEKIENGLPAVREP